jgi:hypothetical protein
MGEREQMNEYYFFLSFVVHIGILDLLVCFLFS